MKLALRMKRPITVNVELGYQSFSVENLSFQGKLYDVNLYGGKEFLEIDFIHELACLENKRMDQLVSMENIRTIIKTMSFPRVHIIKSRKEVMMCHQPCETKSKGRDDATSRHCLVRNLHHSKCHSFCHRIPLELETVDFCLNCIVYYVNCPLWEHLRKHIVQDELPGKDNHQDSMVVVEALDHQRTILEKLNGLVLNISCSEFLSDMVETIFYQLSSNECSSFRSDNLRLCNAKKNQLQCRSCMKAIEGFYTIVFHTARQILKCNLNENDTYRKITRKTYQLPKEDYPAVIEFFLRKKSRTVVGITKKGTWLLDKHVFGKIMHEIIVRTFEIFRNSHVTEIRK